MGTKQMPVLVLEQLLCTFLMPEPKCNAGTNSVYNVSAAQMLGTFLVLEQMPCIF